MKLYVHKWLDKDSKQLCKTGDGRIATSIEQAIEDYHQEESSAYTYLETLVLDRQALTFEIIDIEAEIESRKVREMSDSERAAYWGCSLGKSERWGNRHGAC